MEEKNKIIIVKCKNADSRTADGEISKEELKNNSLLHIMDVREVGNLIADKLKEQTDNHDFTKIQYLDSFYKDLSTRKTGDEFRKLAWWQIHMSERHHLNHSCPKDVNLIDILEMVIDCTVAGLARGGSVEAIYPIEIPDHILQKAIENTKNLILDNVILKDTEE